MAEYPLITETKDLEALVKRLSRVRAIAVDTEADSFFHYFDKLCLLQIGYGDEIALVDPLKLPENGLAPLAPIFANPSICKVLHAADYDLYMLQRYGGLEVRNVFDTMISSQMLGYNAVGLAAIVEKHFGIQLSKDQQKTDWSRRPLRPAQIEYAASDVRYLVELADLLGKELRAKKRLSWARAEFIAVESRVWPERNFDNEGYLRIKGAKQLSPRGLAVLRELFLMRDRRARELDRPPFKVLGNGTLLELAQKPARSRQALAGRKGITDLVRRRLGREVIEAIRRGLEGPEHPPRERRPAANGRRRLDRRREARLSSMKDWRAKRAKELDLDPGVFASNATLEEIIATDASSIEDLQALDQVKSWWVDAFGKEALEVAARLKDSGVDKVGSAGAVGRGSRSKRSGRGRRSQSGS